MKSNPIAFHSLALPARHRKAEALGSGVAGGRR